MQARGITSRPRQRRSIAFLALEARELLAAAGDAELGCLLDGVGGVVPAIGEPDHLRLGSLRLQQVAREIGRGERVQHLANYLAGPQVVRHLVPERVVGHQQESGLSALCQHRLGGAGGLRVSVEHPVKAGGRAFLVGQLRGRLERKSWSAAAKSDYRRSRVSISRAAGCNATDFAELREAPARGAPHASGSNAQPRLQLGYFP
jgi:hypothetical protein